MMLPFLYNPPTGTPAAAAVASSVHWKSNNWGKASEPVIEVDPVTAKDPETIREPVTACEPVKY